MSRRPAPLVSRFKLPAGADLTITTWSNGEQMIEGVIAGVHAAGSLIRRDMKLADGRVEFHGLEDPSAQNVLAMGELLVVIGTYLKTGKLDERFAR